MQAKTNPTLLEIATSSQNLQFLQLCGFHETLLGDLYSDRGFLASENVEVQIRASSSSENPIIRIGIHDCLTEDCEISSDRITLLGGWYVIVRRTEGGGE